MIWTHGPPPGEGWYWLERLHDGRKGIFLVQSIGQLGLLMAMGPTMRFPADKSSVLRHAGPIGEPQELMGAEGEA
jgi:hypothetical protein